tara:strand:- start:382 stop:558 length:177 start_codon:yes stop_codon:yes gene_type:complete
MEEIVNTVIEMVEAQGIDVPNLISALNILKELAAKQELFMSEQSKLIKELLDARLDDR